MINSIFDKSKMHGVVFEASSNLSKSGMGTRTVAIVTVEVALMKAQAKFFCNVAIKGVRNVDHQKFK